MRSSFPALVFLLFLALVTPTPSAAQDPERVAKCKESCRGQPPSGRSWCEQRCESEYQSRLPRMGDINQEQEQEQEQVGENPFVFEDRHFYAGLQSEHGRLWILPKFTNRSTLFKGIDNFRFAVLEAAPETFISPDHWDADNVVFVIEGRATVKLLRPDGRRSINLQPGDILRVKAGTTAYMINRDSSQRIVMVKLLLPVFNPGHFEAFFGAGGQNQESFLRSFSQDILQYAFIASRGQLEKVFGQTTAVIQKASPEQIQSMSHEEGGGGGGLWPLGGGGKAESGAVNIFRQQPTFSNRYGELYEVKADVYEELLDLNVAITLANITQGGMMGPVYNTKATKIAYVAGGAGYMEMVAPSSSISSGAEEGGETQPGEAASSSPSYQRISSPLRAGMLVVIPTGYPFVAVASSDQNLQILCYEVFAYDNEKFPLAGKGNVLSNMEDAAKELAFGVPVKEVDQVLKRQPFEFFFRGPLRQGVAKAA